MVRRALSEILDVYRRQWWRLLLSELIAGTGIAVLVLVFYRVFAMLATALRPALVTGTAYNYSGVLLLAVGATVVFLGLALPLTLAAIAAITRITNDVAGDRRPRLLRSLLLGLILGYTMSASVVLAFLLFAVLLVLSPVISLIGLVALILTPAILAVRLRRAAFVSRWPAARTLVYWAVPTVLAFRWLAVLLLAIPAVVLDSAGPVSSLKAASNAVRSRRLLTLGAALVAFLVGWGFNLLLSLLGSLVPGAVVSSLAQSIGQLASLGLPVVAMAVLYRLFALDRDHHLQPEPLPGARAPRAARAAWPPAIRRVAMVMPGVLVIALFAVAPLSAASAATAGTTYLVNSSADDVAAATLDAEEQNCVAGTGVCTFRAAVTEANTVADGGGTAATTIGFAGDETVLVNPSGPITFNNSTGGDGGAGGGTLTITGNGHNVTIDGQGAVADLSLFSHTWKFVVEDLELRNGLAADATGGEGGGLDLSGASTSVVNDVTFDHDRAVGGGGLYAGGGNVMIENSTFSHNSVIEDGQNSVVGGADLFAGSVQAVAVNDTFADAIGGSIYNWSRAGYSLELDNSLIAVTASELSQGPVGDCSGGGITGSLDVTADGLASCPGITEDNDGYLGSLARSTAGHPPVINLLPNTANAAIGEAGSTDVPCVATDARGQARPNTGCDAGAYQFNPASTTLLSSSANPSSYGDQVTFTAHVAPASEPGTIVTGTVRFSVDGVAVGSPGALDSVGDASYQTTSMATGSHPVTATYLPAAGDAFATSTSASLAQVIDATATTVSLSSDVATAALGTAVTFTMSGGDLTRTLTGGYSLRDVTNGSPGAVIDSNIPIGSNNVGTAVIRNLSAGSHRIVAVYSGDSNNASGMSSPVGVSILATSATTLTGPTSSVVYGAPATLTAHVVGSAGTASGHVIFVNQTTSATVGDLPLDAQETASLTLSSLPAGANDIVAYYQTTSPYSGSTSSAATVLVSAATTATTLAPATGTSSSYGSPVTLTATVKDTSSPGTATPVGTVDFSIGGSSIATVALTPGTAGTATANFTTTAEALPVGSDAVTATFTPDISGNFTSSGSVASTLVITKAASKVTLHTDETPAPYGHPVQLSATVSAAGGSTAVPTGHVIFSDGSTVLGTVPLVGGAATFGVANLARGNHTITATFAATPSFTSSSDSAVQVISTAATSTTVTAPTSSVYGRDATVSVTVAASGGAVPSGAVILKDGDTPIALLTLAGGMATTTISTLGAGDHVITASFAGDGNYLASSGTAPLSVAAAATSTTLVVDKPVITYGSPDVLTATVTNEDGASGEAPEGSIQFQFGSAQPITVPLAAGAHGTATAELDTTTLPAGTQDLEVYASYEPDANFTASSGRAQVEVSPAGTSISLATSAANSTTRVTATATVIGATGAVPTGSVRFTRAPNFVDVVALVDGVATLPLGYLSVGDPDITAVYQSDSGDFIDGLSTDTAIHSFNVGRGVVDTSLTDTAGSAFVYGTIDTLTMEIGVNSAGPSPSGDVDFYATTPRGTVDLGSVALTQVYLPPYLPGESFASSATLSTTAIPIGTLRVYADYSGDSNYQESTNYLLRTVTQPTTTTSIEPSTEPSWVGAPITYAVSVTAQGGGTPEGDVELTSNGSALATSPLIDGRATFTTTPGSVGSSDIVATFLPADGDFAASSASLTHSVVALSTTVALQASLASPGVGQVDTFTATVSPPPGYTSATALAPQGTVVISDGVGDSCTAVAATVIGEGRATGTCAIAFPHAGAVNLTGTYSGYDGLYAGSSSRPYAVIVRKTAPNVVLSSSPSWVGGEAGTIAWTVTGPATAGSATDGGLITIRDGEDKAICTSYVLSGNCRYTFPAATNGQQTLSMTYAPSTDWSGTSSTISPSVVGCVPATAPTASPTAGGSVVRIPEPDCDSGSGFRVGDTVLYFENPNHGYTFGGWTAGTTDADGVASVVVGPDFRQVANTAYFNVACVSVTISTMQSGLRGYVQTDPQEPNCGTRTWGGSTIGSETGSFEPGTVLTLMAKPDPPTNGGPATALTGWNGLLDGEASDSTTTRITLTTGVDRDISARFGVACYVGISFPAPSGGTSSLGSPNCDGLQGVGYSAGSKIPISTRPTGTGYFIGWTGSNNLSLSSVASTASGSSALLNITGSNITVGARYGACIYAPLQVKGPGTAAVTPTGNCPSQGVGWYTPGTQVAAYAHPDEFDSFKGWTGQPINGGIGTFAGTSYSTITTDGPFLASFYAAYQCAPLTFTSVPAGAVSISAAFTNDGGNSCPDGEYDASIDDAGYGTRQVTFTATPQSGAASGALIGFTVTSSHETSRDTTGPNDVPGIQGSTLTMGIGGATTVTATVCEHLDAQLSLVSPNGTAHTEANPADADFIDVTPIPTCPFGTDNYVVSDRPVYPAANGAGAGYTFAGWSGAIHSTSKYPTTGILLDGGARSASLTATYQVVCHTLTSNWANVSVSPDPNCPDTNASAHSYIGGTNVALEATGDGSAIFRGWTGSPDSSNGNIAIATMKADQAVYADYTAETVKEKIVGVVNTIGDGIANTAKKAVGVVSAIASGLILGSNPVIAVVSLVSGLATGVIDALAYFGVNNDAFKTAKSVVADVAAMMTFITSTTNCATVWSNGAGDDMSHDATATGVSGATGNAGATEIQNQQTISDAAEEAEQKAAIAGEYGADVGSGLSTVDKAGIIGGRLGAAALVGVSVYSEFSASSSSSSWNQSASEAWTEGGDGYARCMEDAIPSYFGLPPTPDELAAGQ